MKRNLILIVCVIGLSITGVSYSAWTDGLSIKTIFKTGNVHVIFKNPEIVDRGLYEINADTNGNVLDIYGEAAPSSPISVKYDIYNDSTLPIKFQTDEEDLPSGVTLSQNDAVLEPGKYHRGNRVTIQPGDENNIILPFIQYNAKGKGGWKDELEISWDITEVEATDDIEPIDHSVEYTEVGEE